MPVVTIQQVNRDLDRTRRLVADITQAFVDAYDLPPEQIMILFQDVDREHWAKAGLMGVDYYAAASARDSTTIEPSPKSP